MYFILTVFTVIFIVLNTRKYIQMYKKEREHDWT